MSRDTVTHPFDPRCPYCAQVEKDGPPMDKTSQEYAEALAKRLAKNFNSGERVRDEATAKLHIGMLNTEENVKAFLKKQEADHK